MLVPGTVAFAMYPETTTFYAAKVSSSYTTAASFWT
jgi:hypothetical protein